MIRGLSATVPLPLTLDLRFGEQSPIRIASHFSVGFIMGFHKRGSGRSRDLLLGLTELALMLSVRTPSPSSSYSTKIPAPCLKSWSGLAVAERAVRAGGLELSELFEMI